MKLNPLDRLRRLSTTHLCDASPDVRVMDHSIKPLLFSKKIVGSLFTVKCHGDLLPVIKALEEIEYNKILVIDTHNSPHAVFGEIFSRFAMKKGIKGIVIDGYCRDISDIKNINITVYAKGVSPKAGTKNRVGEFNSSIHCGGISLSPEDIIFGDENGLVVMNSRQLEDLLEKAEQIKTAEEKALIRINQGATMNEILNFKEHYENVAQNIKESNLSWIL